MAKFDPENTFAWEVILERINSLRSEGQTLQAIGKLMGVGKDTVSRWLKLTSGGERNTFGAMIRYAKALDIPYENLIPPSLAKPKSKTSDPQLAQELTELSKENRQLWRENAALREQIARLEGTAKEEDVRHTA